MASRSSSSSIDLPAVSIAAQQRGVAVAAGQLVSLRWLSIDASERTRPRSASAAAGRAHPPPPASPPLPGRWARPRRTRRAIRGRAAPCRSCGTHTPAHRSRRGATGSAGSPCPSTVVSTRGVLEHGLRMEGRQEAARHDQVIDAPVILVHLRTQRMLRPASGMIRVVIGDLAVVHDPRQRQEVEARHVCGPLRVLRMHANELGRRLDLWNHVGRQVARARARIRKRLVLLI